MLRTEAGFYDQHLNQLITSLERRVGEIEQAGEFSAEDEMELAALERLILVLEGEFL